MIRRLLLVRMLCIAAVALPARGESVWQSEREIPVVGDADVVVVGGTLGAVAAAVQASRAGADPYESPGGRLATSEPDLGHFQPLGLPRLFVLSGLAAEAKERGEVRETLRGLRSVDRDHPSITMPALPIPILAQMDIVVVGGGTSGACAAIGAARQGARVLVIEYQEALGGVGTVGR